AAEGSTAVHSVTRPTGQEASAISQASRGGLLKYPAPLSWGRSQSHRTRMSWASRGKRARSFVVSARAPRSRPINPAAARAIHAGPGGHPPARRVRRLDKSETMHNAVRVPRMVRLPSHEVVKPGAVRGGRGPAITRRRRPRAGATGVA